MTGLLPGSGQGAAPPSGATRGRGEWPAEMENAFLPLAKPAPRLGERVPAGDDAFIHHLVRHLVIVFLLKLSVEPAGEISEGFCDGLLGVSGRWLVSVAV